MSNYSKREISKLKKAQKEKQKKDEPRLAASRLAPQIRVRPLARARKKRADE